MKTIRVTNTLNGQKEVLQTITPGKLTFYSCGPTVYNLIHIGNLRGALVSDMFFRYFKRAGYEVIYVRNYTDVDDKIIKRAHEEKTTSEAIAKKYTEEVEKDFKACDMLEPTYKTTVTTHIADIIQMIQRIIKNQKAYVTDDGEVLFSIDHFPEYGKLSGKNLDELQSGIRVSVRDNKKNPLDFTLWKPAKPDEPAWESPWGKGRPGWHIECSAMSSKWLGDQIDVHHGGEDLIFPHHENEIAQSEGACGRVPFVRYWIHHAFLTMSKEKMSKSLGNVMTARDFLTQYSGEVARYLLLSVYYRSPIDYGDEAVEQALSSLTRIYETKSKACEILALRTNELERPSVGSEWEKFIQSCDRGRQQIDDAFANDFNSSEALATLFSLIREFNRLTTQSSAITGAALGAQRLVEIMENDIGDILGVGKSDPAKALQSLLQIRQNRASVGGEARPEPQEIERLIQERIHARKAKDFAKADEIRKSLEARGVLLKDSPSGTRWTYQ